MYLYSVPTNSKQLPSLITPGSDVHTTVPRNERNNINVKISEEAGWMYSTVTDMSLLDGKRNKYFYYTRFYTIKTRLIHDRYKVDFSHNKCVTLYYIENSDYRRRSVDIKLSVKGLNMIINFGFEIGTM